MIEQPKLYGASYSVYVRIVRLALAEKGVAYRHVPIDIFNREAVPADYVERHPFGRIPAFEHDGFSLYETGAIARYVDEAFEGPPLQPAEVRARARCNQIISIADTYAYPHLVWGLYVETASKPKRGEQPDVKKVARAREVGETCLTAIARLLADQPWLAGGALTLADLHAAPMFAYLLQATMGEQMLDRHTNLRDWWSRMSERPSMAETSPQS